MKLMSLILLLLFSTLQVFAPEQKALYLVQGSVINYYDPLIRAVVMVESAGGKYLFNAKECAIGPFQIRACRIDHFNKLTGLSYALNDCYDYEISKKVFLFFAHGKNYESAARSWNGAGKQTDKYWAKIKKLL